MLRGLYDWMLTQAGRRHALWVLAGLSFAESSVFPIPPDVMLIPMVLAVRERAWLIAGVCTIASVSGGFAGYAIGHYLFDALGQPLIEFYGYEDKFAVFRDYYNEWGGWIVAAGGFTPLPYKVITIASGATSLDPWVFLVASTLARGARFFLVAALLWKFGPPIRNLIERHLGKFAIAFFALLIGAFLVIKVIL